MYIQKGPYTKAKSLFQTHHLVISTRLDALRLRNALRLALKNTTCSHESPFYKEIQRLTRDIEVIIDKDEKKRGPQYCPACSRCLHCGTRKGAKSGRVTLLRFHKGRHF